MCVFDLFAGRSCFFVHSSQPSHFSVSFGVCSFSTFLLSCSSQTHTHTRHRSSLLLHTHFSYTRTVIYCNSNRSNAAHELCGVTFVASHITINLAHSISNGNSPFHLSSGDGKRGLARTKMQHGERVWQLKSEWDVDFPTQIPFFTIRRHINVLIAFAFRSYRLLLLNCCVSHTSIAVEEKFRQLM